MKIKVTVRIDEEDKIPKPPSPKDIIVATVGKLVVTEGTTNMPPKAQVYPAVGAPPLLNSVSPLITKIPLTGFELFNDATGADDGADNNVLTFSVSDTTLATVAPGSSFTPPISAPFVVALTPGLPTTGTSTIKVTITDDKGNAGELDITFGAPPVVVAVPDVIVATVGTPVVS